MFPWAGLWNWTNSLGDREGAGPFLSPSLLINTNSHQSPHWKLRIASSSATPWSYHTCVTLITWWPGNSTSWWTGVCKGYMYNMHASPCPHNQSAYSYLQQIMPSLELLHIKECLCMGEHSHCLTHPRPLLVKLNFISTVYSQHPQTMLTLSCLLQCKHVVYCIVWCCVVHT